jgi:hypothetical protein
MAAGMPPRPGFNRVRMIDRFDHGVSAFAGSRESRNACFTGAGVWAVRGHFSRD